MHKACYQKCIDTKPDIHIALLQIRSTLLGPGLSSPAMLLFNHTIQGIMPIVNIPPVNLNNDDEHYEAVVHRQMKNYKNNDTFRKYASFSMGSTVVAQYEDGVLCTHCTVIGKEDHSHNNRSYMICLTKRGQIVTRNRKHIKAIPITAEQYF